MTLAVNPRDGHLWLAAQDPDRMQVFGDDGQLPCRFWCDTPAGLAFDGNGVVISQFSQCRLSVHAANATFMHMHGFGDHVHHQCRQLLDLLRPAALATSADGGLLYVADTNNHRIHVFHRDGRFLRDWFVGGCLVDPETSHCPEALAVSLMDDRLWICGSDECIEVSVDCLVGGNV